MLITLWVFHKCCTYDLQGFGLNHFAGLSSSSGSFLQFHVTQLLVKVFLSWTVPWLSISL